MEDYISVIATTNIFHKGITNNNFIKRDHNRSQDN